MVHRQAHNAVGAVLGVLLVAGLVVALFQGCSGNTPVGQAYEFGNELEESQAQQCENEYNQNTASCFDPSADPENPYDAECVEVYTAEFAMCIDRNFDNNWGENFIQSEIYSPEDKLNAEENLDQFYVDPETKSTDEFDVEGCIQSCSNVCVSSASDSLYFCADFCGENFKTVNGGYTNVNGCTDACVNELESDGVKCEKNCITNCNRGKIE